MKKRGFTLIELLAVIVIMGIILAIAIPSIASIIMRSTENTWENQKKIIIDAAQKYIALNPEKIPTKDKSINIPLEELINEGLIDEIIDPRTDEKLSPTTAVVKVTNEGNGKIAYKFISDEAQMPIESGGPLLFAPGSFGIREDLFRSISIDEIPELKEHKEILTSMFGEIDGGLVSFGPDYLTITYENRFDYSMRAFRTREAFKVDNYDNFGLRYYSTSTGFDYWSEVGGNHSPIELSKDKLYYINLIIYLIPEDENENQSALTAFLGFTESDTKNTIMWNPVLINELYSDSVNQIKLKVDMVWLGISPE